MRKTSMPALLALGLLLAACGGGTPPPPSSITLTVEDPMGSFNAAAYQVGSGAWQPLTMSGTTTKTGTFSLGSQSKYGVAVRCSSLVVKVIQATASELANPKVVCSSPVPSTVSFTVNVSVDSSLPSGGACVNGMGCLFVPSGGSVSVTTNLKPGNQDLLLTLVSSGGVEVAKVLKNVNVTSGGNTSASLAPGDQLSPVNLTPPPTPSGYTTGPLLVFYLSAGGATGLVLVNASPTSYRPVKGFGSGDRYVALVQSTGTNASLMSAQVFASGAPSLALPAPWTTGSLSVTQGAHPNVTGLSRTEPDLRSYRFYLQIAAQIYYTATVSKGWLGSATSYALPDLSASTLLGYTAPTGSGSFEITAFFSNKPLLSQDAADPSSFQAGDYIREATAMTNSYNASGSGNISLP